MEMSVNPENPGMLTPPGMAKMSKAKVRMHAMDWKSASTSARVWLGSIVSKVEVKGFVLRDSAVHGVID